MIGKAAKLIPVCAMYLARGMSDFADHQEQVLPHLPRQLPAIGFGQMRKDAAQILIDNSPSQFDNIASDKGQQPGDRIASLDPQRLNDADKNADEEIERPIR
jgi:hypothetical protein